MFNISSVVRLLSRVIILALATSFSASASTSTSLDVDISSVKASRAGLQSIIRYLDEQTELLNPQKDSIPSEVDREAVRTVWQTFLDHILALDVIGERNNLLYHHGSPEEKDRAFQLSFAAFLTEYRYALEFLKRSESSPQLHVLLNEPVPELGLPAETYSQIKYRFLNVLRATEFSWLAVKYKSHKRDNPLSSLIDDDIDYITRIDKHGGPALTAKNAGKIVSDAMFTTWFPVQKGVSEWMGDTKVLRHGKDLITDEQLHDIQALLQPGDILLVRREWYLSNIGLPGYWPHAALYVGTAEERHQYFADEKSHAWVRSQGEPSGDIEKLISSRSPSNYLLSKQASNGELPHVIEAISEGVSFTGLRHAAGGDSLAILRPRLAKEIKARAILRAFQLAGRPYDFDFNFLTDSSLVCTELVYKAYEGTEGLSLPLETVLGRPVLPANGIAKLFDEEYSSPTRQFDFVAFYDGDERSQQAIVSDVEAFRSSSQRPKWHIFLPASKPNMAKSQ